MYIIDIIYPIVSICKDHIILYHFGALNEININTYYNINVIYTLKNCYT